MKIYLDRKNLNFWEKSLLSCLFTYCKTALVNWTRRDAVVRCSWKSKAFDIVIRKTNTAISLSICQNELSGHLINTWVSNSFGVTIDASSNTLLVCCGRKWRLKMAPFLSLSPCELTGVVGRGASWYDFGLAGMY